MTKKTIGIPRVIWLILFGLLLAIPLTGFAMERVPQLIVEHESGQAALQIAEECGECHLDISENWSHSSHAHAFDDSVFQERWSGMGEPGECLVCHTTNYQQTTGEYTAEGVSCEACHAETPLNHPPEPVPILADTEYCGICHTTTLGEWRLTGHANAKVGCMDCHDPHSQQALFDVSDDMCINCHQEDMGPYLEDLHIQKEIGCVDCHALVIPPEEVPEDGIVPTGHSFTITPATCVACHTDALHAGFSLPGYENGAAGTGETAEAAEEETGELSFETEELESSPGAVASQLERELETTRATLANRSMTFWFQGGIVGLVLGGTTAWIVANNVRRGRKEQDDDEA
jgi:predicted CXXCH cytochrome family protein